MQKSKPQIMENKNAQTDRANLEMAGKRPISILLRDPKTKQYNSTTIWVSDDDPRTDWEIAQEYRQQYKYSRELHKARMQELKLTRNPNGTAGKPYRWEYKDPDNQTKLDLNDSIDAIHNLMK